LYEYALLLGLITHFTCTYQLVEAENSAKNLKINKGYDFYYFRDKVL